MTNKKWSNGQRTALAKDLKSFSIAILTLGEIAPDRMTLSQLAFFLYAAMADMQGRPATFSDIREAAGDKIGKSMHTTYKILLSGSRRSDAKNTPGVDWLRREEDPTDNRRKFLRLTPRGRLVIDELLEALS